VAKMPSTSSSDIQDKDRAVVAGSKELDELMLDIGEGSETGNSLKSLVIDLSADPLAVVVERTPPSNTRTAWSLGVMMDLRLATLLYPCLLLSNQPLHYTTPDQYALPQTIPICSPPRHPSPQHARPIHDMPDHAVTLHPAAYERRVYQASISIYFLFFFLVNELS
jgi:hypothetical protein